MKLPLTSSGIIKRIFRFSRAFIISVLTILFLVIILLQFSFIQNMLVPRINTEIQKLFLTKASIGSIHLSFPKKLVIGDVYLEDMDKDTLIYMEKISINVNITDLIFKKLNVKKIELTNGKANIFITKDSLLNISRTLNPTDNPPDTTAENDRWKINFGKLSLADIRFMYADSIATNYVTGVISKAGVEIKEFDLERSQLIAENMYFKNCNISFSKDTANPVVPTPAPPENGFNLLFQNDITLDGCKFFYSDNSSATAMNASIGTLTIEIDKFDLNKKDLIVDYCAIENTSVGYYQGNSIQTPVQAQDTLLNGWNIHISGLDLDNQEIKLENILKDKPIHIQNLTIESDNLSLHDGYLNASFNNISFQDNFGIGMKYGKLEITGIPGQTIIPVVELQTGQSRISAKLQIDQSLLLPVDAHFYDKPLKIDLIHSSIAMNEVRSVYPEIDSLTGIDLRDVVIKSKLDIEGSLNNLHFKNIAISPLPETHITGTLDLSELMHGKPVLLADLKASFSGNIIHRILSSDQSAIILPDNIDLRLRGKASETDSNLDMEVNSKQIDLSGKVLSSLDQNTMRKSEISLNVRNIHAGNILNDTTYGQVKGTINIRIENNPDEVTGIDFELKADTLYYAGYNFTNISASATSEHHNWISEISISDPELNLSLLTEGPFVSMSEFNLTHHLTLKRANVALLGLFPQPVLTSTNADLTSIRDDNLLHLDLNIRDFYIEEPDKKYVLPFLRLSLNSDSLNTGFQINSELVNASFASNFSLKFWEETNQERWSDLKKLILKDTTGILPGKYITLNATIPDPEFLTFVFPDIETISIDSIRAGFDGSENLVYAITKINHLETENIKADTFDLRIHSTEKGFEMISTLKALYFDSLFVRDILFQSKYIHDQFVSILQCGPEMQPDYLIKSYFIPLSDEKGFQIKIDPERIILNKTSWSIQDDNFLRSENNRWLSNGLILTQGNQSFSTRVNDKKIHLEFRSFNISNFTDFLQNPSERSMISGMANGEINIEFPENHTILTSNFSINDLALKNMLLGDLYLDIENPGRNRLDIDMSLKNQSNDIRFTGTYSLLDDRSLSAKLRCDLRDISIYEPLLTDGITGLNGQVAGDLELNGTVGNLKGQGVVSFTNTQFYSGTLNSTYIITNENLKLKDNIIHFDKFTIRDPMENKFLLNGTVSLVGDQPVNLEIRTDNFPVINTSRNENSSFFGKLIVEAVSRIQGNLKSPKIKSNIRIKDQTALTYVLPSSTINLISDEGIVNWDTDTLIETRYSLSDSLFENLEGLNIDLQLTIDKGASFRVDIDPNSGDYITLKGSGNLNFNYDEKTSEPNLSGNYEITSGVYQVSFYGMAKKTFLIREGSAVSWTGDPMEANIRIQASYVIRTSSMTLVAKQMDDISEYEKKIYNQALPYEISILINGNINSPDIQFELDLSDEYTLEYPAIHAKLSELNQTGNESELNRQVFGLLTLGGFLPESLDQNVGATFATTAAANSINGILTNQLNRMSGNMIKGVDFNVDLTSHSDYTSGKTKTTMDFSVTKKLANDLISIEAGGYMDLDNDVQTSGNNFKGDIAIVYNLSKKGNIKLKTYNEASYDMIYKDIRSSGISLIFIKDFGYNRNKKKKDKKKP